MENNEWEDQLRSLLGDDKTPDPHSPMGMNNDAPDSHVDPASSIDDQAQTWKRIEASLNAADQAFDETIRQRVHQFHPTYDPHSWPLLLHRLADTRYLKTKLVILKSIEVSMVLLLLLSAINMERVGKFPFDSSPLKSDQRLETPGSNELEKATLPGRAKDQLDNTKPANKDFVQVDENNQTESNTNSGWFVVNDAEENKSGVQKSSLSNSGNENISPFSSHNSISDESREDMISAQASINSSNATSAIPSINMNGLEFTVEPGLVPAIAFADETYITEPLASADLIIDHTITAAVPSPKFVNPISRTYTEFAVLAQADYNALKMPEDHLYSSGREIVFPSKGIMSPGYGAGFTIAIGHPIWALETGVIYSAKDFKPGRQLVVGGAFDNGSVEFEAMKLQLVSVPVQYRYRFDRQGRLKSYVMAGGGFHVIAQSDIDVQIEYHFASLAFGENPNNDPTLAATIQESRRVREHILDRAPFSTKSFVSLNAGLGIEYMLNEHKAIFFQTVAQYQIPNIAFSNNNGKHLRSVSLQAGIRGPLGK